MSKADRFGCTSALSPTPRALFPAGTLAIARASSGNKKIGDAATTYVEQRSCPSSCPFFGGGGCYAEEGRLGKVITGPLNRAAAEVAATPEDIARFEAAQIDGLEVVPGQPLRLHTVGDCKTDAAAAIVAAAAARYEDRGGGPVWTYSHAWRDVSVESWGSVHVLASCETADDVREAEARGYASSVVVETFARRGRYEHDGRFILPCPAQTKDGVTCSSCRLCMNSLRLRDAGLTIAFAIHGTELTKHRARLALDDPDNPDRRLSSRVLIPRLVASYLAKEGREPSTRELADAIGISPSSVHQMRRRLADEAAAAAQAVTAAAR
jgi:hypothetical protein